MTSALHGHFLIEKRLLLISLKLFFIKIYWITKKLPEKILVIGSIADAKKPSPGGEQAFKSFKKNLKNISLHLSFCQKLCQKLLKAHSKV